MVGAINARARVRPLWLGKTVLESSVEKARKWSYMSDLLDDSNIYYGVGNVLRSQNQLDEK